MIIVTDGARNPFYESMREVSPGDVLFPAEFREAGQNRENVRLNVDTRAATLLDKVRLKDQMDLVRTVHR